MFSNNNSNSPTQGGGLFGGNTGGTGGGLFGNTGTAQGGGLFGGNTGTPLTVGGVFGNTETYPAQGGGLFGGNAQRTTGGGLFGGNTGGTGGGVFGNTETSPAQGGGLFGGNAGSPPPFGGPKPAQSGGLFGGNTGATTGGLFGNTSTASAPAQGGGLFGGSQSQSASVATQPTTSPSKGIEANAVANQDAKPQEVWKGESSLYVANIKQLFLEKEFSDVIFEVQGEEFHGHRNLLAIRCKSFNDKFKDKQSGSDILKIQITDMAPEVFRALLEFTYCNEVRLTEALALDLIKVSNQYAFPELKEVCGTFLAKSLSLDNFAKLADIAENEQVAGLRNSVLDYVATNFNQVKQREDHNNLPKSMLWDLVCRLQQKK